MLVFSAANVSEGRRSHVIAAIAAAVCTRPAVSLLDLHSDPDHNRSVFSVAGPPAAMSEAMFALIQGAAQHIDMERHEGQHPRIGAADVVPFTPLQGSTLAQCRDLARGLCARVGGELQLPVYLYGAAARSPDARQLADIRRGGYEGLRIAIDKDERRRPDCGPSTMGRGGAVAIGAREALIAWNVWLDTADVQVARRIARRIRASGGGLPALQALGMRVAGRAQVSMNLTDYRRTGLAAVMAALRREARREGVNLYGSELVGLIPRAALDAATGCDLQLLKSPCEQVLERRLVETGLIRSDRLR
ncbi:MAG: glutamate formimidoyltransferase [Anaerolineaceae bacterium]|nr:glutamate formimidoyltransferase [Anaerolineaceae bacterium]